MKTNSYTKFKYAFAVLSIFSLFSLTFFSSCEKDSDGGSSFSLKDNPTSLEASSQGTSETYTVQSAGAWRVEPLRDERWVKIEPREGNGAGTFTVTIDRNTTLEARQSVLTFVVDGKIQNNVLKVEQEARTIQDGDEEPYVNLDGMSSLEAPASGLIGRYAVRSTGDWKLEILEGADWLNIEPMEGKLDMGVNLSTDVNMSPDVRTAKVAFYLDGERTPGVFEVNQKGAVIILFEDFDWLNYGSTTFNVTGGETKIGDWVATEQEKGWTSTINPAEGGGNYASIYARDGFIKLGRTNFGGDLISPKLSEIQGTQNVQVTFKAALYMTAGGNPDHNLLKVGVNGPGTVSVSELYINNLPDYVNDPLCIAVWRTPEATQTFTITGATSETQVWFLGGAFDMRAGTGWPKTVNRIFLDDILVTLIED